MRISERGSGDIELDSDVFWLGMGRLEDPGRELFRESGAAVSSMISSISFAEIVALVGALLRCAFMAGDWRIVRGTGLDLDVFFPLTDVTGAAAWETVGLAVSISMSLGEAASEVSDPRTEP